MVQTVSLHGAKAQAIVHTQSKPTDKENAIRYTPLDLRFLSQLKSSGVRAPVHEDFNSFLASSTSQIQGKMLDAIKQSVNGQNHRFGPEDSSLQKSEGDKRPKPMPALNPELSKSLDKNHHILLSTIPRVLENLNLGQVAQPIKAQYPSDKGYGSRIVTDPLIVMAASTDLDKISMGLVGAVHGRSSTSDKESDEHNFGESGPKSKTSIKANQVGRSEHASLLRREEIEVLRDVKEKFVQQLKAQYPHISVPIKHPEGIVDVHMRFDRKAMGPDGMKGSVRVMFCGSNPQIVTLFAQHREEFMKIITRHGYAIDPSRMQFNGPTMKKEDKEI
jgi:hypothetical protein